MFERKIEWTPAYDKRSKDPKKNYGIHGMELRFLLKGEKGVIQFLMYTGWDLEHVREERKKSNGTIGNLFPMAADIGYHSPYPHYEGQTVINQECPYLGGKPCYYDGSGLNAIPLMEILISQGDEALWKKLKEYYQSVFESEKK